MIEAKKIFIPLTSIILIILLGICHGFNACKLHLVVKVFDGDTIQLDDGRRIRLIGVDAPEVDSSYRRQEPFGEESKNYLTSFILNKRVSITLGDPPLDKYNRSLAYVYLGDILVNGRIIRDGLALAYRKFYHPWRDLFLVYEREARSKGRGMWKEKDSGARNQKDRIIK
jgi:micrococcal nuclease